MNKTLPYGMTDVARLQASQAQSAAAAKNSSRTLNARQIDKAAEDFEAVFLTQMLQGMFEGVSLDPLAEEGETSNEVYKSFMLDEYGKILSRSGGIGLADHVKRELLRLQEVNSWSTVH